MEKSKKMFIIRELVPANIHRTIYVEAESEKAAKRTYYNDPDSCLIDEVVDAVYAEILEIEEVKE